MKEQFLEIRLPKCLIVLTKGELLTLLRQDPELWRKALKRGKVVRRRRQAEKRNRFDPVSGGEQQAIERRLFKKGVMQK